MLTFDESFNDLESGVHALFKFAYLTNWGIEGDKLGKQEMKTLEELSALEVLDNFKDLTINLL